MSQKKEKNLKIFFKQMKMKTQLPKHIGCSESSFKREDKAEN